MKEVKKIIYSMLKGILTFWIVLIAILTIGITIIFLT